MDNQFSGSKQDEDDSSDSMGDTYDNGCIECRDEIRKSLLTINDSFLYNERVPQEMVKEYFEQIKKIQNQMLMNLETDSQGMKKRWNMNLHVMKEHTGHLRRGSTMYWTIRCSLMFVP